MAPSIPAHVARSEGIKMTRLRCFGIVGDYQTRRPDTDSSDKASSAFKHLRRGQAIPPRTPCSEGNKKMAQTRSIVDLWPRRQRFHLDTPPTTTTTTVGPRALRSPLDDDALDMRVHSGGERKKMQDSRGVPPQQGRDARQGGRAV
ncbi:hypothetical protein QBC39DRAFT_385408 [Podospora conica]|nr:hypothetical protein QBC39DRAFT_385408 [Schizothecium conicum]